MNRSHIALTIILALAAGFAGKSLADAASWTTVAANTRAAAEEGDASESRWEYCAVLKAQTPGSLRGGVYWISYFKGERIETQTIEAGPTSNALSKALNKLGNEGWEMVGQGPLEVIAAPGGTPTALYFKRKKTDK